MSKSKPKFDNSISLLGSSIIVWLLASVFVYVCACVCLSVCCVYLFCLFLAKGFVLYSLNTKENIWEKNERFLTETFNRILQGKKWLYWPKIALKPQAGIISLCPWADINASNFYGGYWFCLSLSSTVGCFQQMITTHTYTHILFWVGAWTSPQLKINRHLA